ncbi:hypothetical protein [Streptomyces flaveus]|uniref:hypothetical protein n=1 Tax=Streptomyces flaveus TaxID=66370 RepID=UPI003319BF39
MTGRRPLGRRAADPAAVGRCEAYEAGRKVHRPQLPDEIEVCYADGRVYRLAPDGVRTVVEAAR